MTRTAAIGIVVLLVVGVVGVGSCGEEDGVQGDAAMTERRFWTLIDAVHAEAGMDMKVAVDRSTVTARRDHAPGAGWYAGVVEDSGFTRFAVLVAVVMLLASCGDEAAPEVEVAACEGESADGREVAGTYVLDLDATSTALAQAAAALSADSVPLRAWSDVEVLEPEAKRAAFLQAAVALSRGSEPSRGWKASLVEDAEEINAISRDMLRDRAERLKRGDAHAVLTVAQDGSWTLTTTWDGGDSRVHGKWIRSGAGVVFESSVTSLCYTALLRPPLIEEHDEYGHVVQVWRRQHGSAD